jgi:hypothetical protein
MMVNALNAAKKYPSCRKKLWLNLPTKQVEDTEGSSPRSFFTTNAHLRWKKLSASMYRYRDLKEVMKRGRVDMFEVWI